MSIWLVTVMCLLVLTAFAVVMALADGRQRTNLLLGAALLGFWVVFGTAAISLSSLAPPRGSQDNWGDRLPAYAVILGIAAASACCLAVEAALRSSTSAAEAGVRQPVPSTAKTVAQVSSEESWAGDYGRPTYRSSFLRSLGSVEDKVWFNGKSYRIFSSDREVIDFLDTLAWHLYATSDGLQPATLLGSRRDLQAITARPTIGALVAVLAKGNPLTSRWALWLLGHSHNKAAVLPLRPFLEHPEPAFRKEAVRALRRLGAWYDLLPLRHDPVERIRWLATPRPRQSTEPTRGAKAMGDRFSSALERLTARAEPAAEEAPDRSPMPYWSVVTLGEGQAPRPTWWLRRILERIQQAVRGSMHTGIKS
ncbi:MAG: HEAT repeat domain-containing protein [Pirellulales bacterium]